MTHNPTNIQNELYKHAKAESEIKSLLLTWEVEEKA